MSKRKPVQCQLYVPEQFQRIHIVKLKSLAGRPSTRSLAAVAAVCMKVFVRMHTEKPESRASRHRYGRDFVHYIPALGK